MTQLKYLSLIVLFSILSMANNFAQNKEKVELEYDSVLAKEVGADDYGMRKYVIAFLKRGPNKSISDEERIELQKAHMENIGKMSESNKLVLAGPFFGDGELRGIYVFAVNSIEEAKKLTESDPAIQAQTLEMELMEWYGSAALMKIKEIYPKLAKKKI